MPNLNDQLITAIGQGDLNKVKELISQGVDVRSQDDLALKWAANRGHLEVVKYLVSQGADVRAEDDYALRWSVAMGHIEVVQFLKLCMRTDQMAVFIRERLMEDVK